MGIIAATSRPCLGLDAWVVIAPIVICECFTLTVFLYQRSVRRIAQILGFEQKTLRFFYPPSLCLMYNASFLKWPCYVYLLLTHWAVAIGLLVLFFAASIILPVSHQKNLLVMRERLKSSFSWMPREVYTMILDAVDDELEQAGYNLLTLEEYRRVKILYLLSDDALAVLMQYEGVFGDASQAMLHIKQIRARLNLTSTPTTKDTENFEQLDLFSSPTLVDGGGEGMV